MVDDPGLMARTERVGKEVDSQLASCCRSGSESERER